MPEVKLTHEELQLLDGKVSDEAQKVVDQAKVALAVRVGTELTPGEAEMVAKIVAAAKANGKLTFNAVSIKLCPCCGRSDGYWPLKRARRYQRAGEPNYDSPKLFRGYDCNRGFVTMDKHIFTGFCDSCKDRVLPALRPLLTDIKAEMPESLTGVPMLYRKWGNRECAGCGWKGHEGQMGMLPAMMQGMYHGFCPQCGVENLLFRDSIKIAEGYTVDLAANENRMTKWQWKEQQTLDKPLTEE